MAPPRTESARRSGRLRGRGNQAIHDEKVEPPMNPVDGQAVVNPANATITITMEALESLLRTAASDRRAELQAMYVKDFIEFDPLPFDGFSLDPIDAITWISSMESIFEYINCPEDHKVRCVVFKLRHAASSWWESAKRSFNDSPITWAQFKKVFYEKYYSDAARLRKQDEFLNLKQGNRSVDEYDTEFLKLACCVPEFVDTEAKMTERFIMGLRDEIRGMVAAFSPPNYSRVFQVAKLIDNRRTTSEPRVPLDSGSSSRRKRKFDQPSSRMSLREQGATHQTQVLEGTNDVKPMCNSCGKLHWGRCLLGMGVCFKCGQGGHMARGCPMNNIGGRRS